MPLWILLAILTATAVYDYVYREIPQFVPLAVLGLAAVSHILAWQSVGGMERLWGVGVGFLLSLVFYTSGGFGGGDVKLISSMGAVLGWKALLAVLFYVAIIGGFSALISRLRQEAEFAYGPSIALGLLAFILRGYFPGAV